MKTQSTNAELCAPSVPRLGPPACFLPSFFQQTFIRDHVPGTGYILVNKTDKVLALTETEMNKRSKYIFITDYQNCTQGIRQAIVTRKQKLI